MEPTEEKTEEIMEEKLLASYQEMVNKGESNINAYTVAQNAGVTEKELFAHFPGVEAIGGRIWLNLGKDVAKLLNESTAYQEYPARQKVLSYFFTFFELAVESRTFIEHTWCQDGVVKPYKDEFKLLMGEIMQEGVDTDDIRDRLSLSSRYPIILWELHQKLLKFWLNDTSDGFVQTEKAIESYSRIPLELMGPNLIDSLFDTIKFELERKNIRVNNPFKMS